MLVVVLTWADREANFVQGKVIIGYSYLAIDISISVYSWTNAKLTLNSKIVICPTRAYGFFVCRLCYERHHSFFASFRSIINDKSNPYERRDRQNQKKNSSPTCHHADLVTRDVRRNERVVAIGWLTMVFCVLASTIDVIGYTNAMVETSPCATGKS